MLTLFLQLQLQSSFYLSLEHLFLNHVIRFTGSLYLDVLFLYITLTWVFFVYFLPLSLAEIEHPSHA